MRRATLLVLVALAAALATTSTARADAAVVSDVVVDGSGGRLRELAVHSPALGRDAGVRVLLPAGFDDPANANRTWPILWLLHGAGDDHTTWTRNTDVEGLTAGLPVVVAMPAAAGRNLDAGWYTDWVDGPQWETFHLRELLPLVESRFHAGGDRSRRLIAGLSMGGFGTMTYAARHPDLFVGAASFSGAVDTTLGAPVTPLVLELLHPGFGTPDDRVWGPYETSEVVWRGHNPTDLASNLDPVALWLRSGNGVPALGDNVASSFLELGVYGMNVSFEGALTRAGVAHSWTDRGHGTHEWHYWQADLAAVLPPFMALLASPPASPAVFRYRFVDDTMSVFGWTFAVTGRGGPAFTELTGVSASGLTAAGIGTLEVTTPPGYEGTWRVDGNEIGASDDGRLRFSVALSTRPRPVAFAAVAPPPRSEPAGPSDVDTTLGHAHSELPASGPSPSAGPALAALGLGLGLSLVGRAARRARGWS